MGLICPVDLLADSIDGFCMYVAFLKVQILIDDFPVLQLWNQCFFEGTQGTEVTRILQNVHAVYNVRSARVTAAQPAEECYEQVLLQTPPIIFLVNKKKSFFADVRSKLMNLPLN